MNPLGDETSVMALFGVCTAAVLILSLALRSRRHPIVVTTLAGLLCGTALYAIIAAVGLLTQGTDGYHIGWWLLLVGAGMIPAAAIGLVEGFVAGFIVHQFERSRQRAVGSGQ